MENDQCIDCGNQNPDDITYNNELSGFVCVKCLDKYWECFECGELEIDCNFNENGEPVCSTCDE